MCKDSKDPVKELAKRQRGLDARGNDPLATKRESSWAAAFIKDPPPAAMTSTLTYLKAFPDTAFTKDEKARMANFQDGLKKLGDTPTGMEFANFFADGDNTQFKKVIDDIMAPVGTKKATDDIDKVGRENQVFRQRGRDENVMRMRRQSLRSPHVGITTGNDRTADTEGLYSGDFFHAQAQFRGKMDSETVKKFQKSGAPFVGGASGTIHAVAVEMQIRGDMKPVEALDPDTLRERERVLAMLSVQHVAAGHHSMAECLVAAKHYGYFKDVSNPLDKYDEAMKELEAHLGGLGLVRDDAPPLSRASENKDKGKTEVKYDDQASFTKTMFERYQDQLPPEERQKIENRMQEAASEAKRGKHGNAIKMLSKAQNMVRGQAAVIAGNARGNSRVPNADELNARMREAAKASKGAKEPTAEFKAVKDKLAGYELSMKQIGGRKMDHDRAGLAFEALRSQLAEVEAAIEAYTTRFATKNTKGGKKDSADAADGGGGDASGQAAVPKNERVRVMDDLKAKIAAEMKLLREAEREIGRTEADGKDHRALTGAVTIAEAVEYARFGINPVAQGRPDTLKQSRVTGQKLLGAGGINTVMLVDYADENGKPAEQRAFKPEPERNTTVTHMLDQVGIDPENPKFGKRNIASRKMAEAAGLGGLMPDAAFAMVDGTVGLAMEKANGDPPVRRAATDITDLSEHPQLQAAIDARAKDPGWKSKIPEKQDGTGMRYGFNDDTGQFTLQKKTRTVLPLKPPANDRKIAAMQKQLINLQWLDALCGQTDRHEENYVVDLAQDTPVVVGIDNDFSFGSKRTDPEARQSSSLGLPPIIDEETFDSLKKMDWDATAQALLAELYSAEEKAGIEKEIYETEKKMEANAKEIADLERDKMKRENEAALIAAETKLVGEEMDAIRGLLPPDADMAPDIDPAIQAAKDKLDVLGQRLVALGKSAAAIQAVRDRVARLQSDVVSQAEAIANPTPEIKAAKSRFDKVQQKLDDLRTDGMVVKGWDETVKGKTIGEFLLDRTSPPTYYMREASYQ